MDVYCCPACCCEKYIPYPHRLYRRCDKCGSLYQFSEIEKIEDYYSGRMPDFNYQAGSYRIYLRIMRRHIEIESYHLVDIGAGDGTFLDIAKPFVRQVLAREASPTARFVLAEKGYLSTISLSRVNPKIVTAWQVIEHVQDPRAFIADLHIGKRDWLVITSPAPDAPTAQRFHSTGRWRSLSPSHHLCLYSKEGLERLATDCNLSLTHYEYTWSGCHGAFDNLRKYILRYVKWAIKRVLGEELLPPMFYGKNSFIAILRNQTVQCRIGKSQPDDA
jgi:hypothetical protein